MIWDIIAGIVLGGTILSLIFEPSFIDQKHIREASASLKFIIRYAAIVIVLGIIISYLEKTYNFKLFGF